MTTIFSDDFESGNLNTWTNQNQPTPPVLTLSQLWRTSETTSLRFKNETNNTHVFQLQKTITNQQTVCLSAYVIFNSLDFPTTNNQFTLFSATTTSSSELPLINLQVIKHSSGNYYFKNGTTEVTSTPLQTGVVYRVQWIVRHFTSRYEDNYDNIFQTQLYVDGVSLSLFSKYVDFNGPYYYVNSVGIGSSVATSGAVGEFFLDDFR